MNHEQAVYRPEAIQFHGMEIQTVGAPARFAYTREIELHGSVRRGDIHAAVVVPLTTEEAQAVQAVIDTASQRALDLFRDVTA